MKDFKTICKKMEKRVIKCGDIETKRQTFYQHIRPISIDNIDVNKIVVSNKNDFKYFIGYKDAKIKLDL